MNTTVLQWHLDNELPALVATSDRHHDVYIITAALDGCWRLDHPWSVTSTLNTARPEICPSLWAAIEEAERMETEGTRFPEEGQ